MITDKRVSLYRQRGSFIFGTFEVKCQTQESDIRKLGLWFPAKKCFVSRI